MSFERKFNTLLGKSDNSLYELSYDDGIELYIYDKDSKFKYKKKFVSGNYNFSNAFFNVDNKDSVYGVIYTKDKYKKKFVSGNYNFSNAFFNVDNKDSVYGVIYTKDNTLLYTYINQEHIYKSTLLKIDNPKLKITFPYIKKIDNKIHLFYYLVDTTTSDECTLIHYYYNGHKWVKTEMDRIKYYILTNFVITFNDNNPTILYLNDNKGYEEVFIARFNEKTSSWNSSIQVTNTGKTKVYLSAIEFPKNQYHIVFSENNSDRYHCAYYSGELVDNKFNRKDYTIIQDAVACEFPHILKVNNGLYIQWLEFSELFTSFSEDNGSTWSNPKFIIQDAVACEFPHILKVNNGLYIQWLEFSELFTSFSEDNGSTWSNPKFFFNDTDDSIIRYDYKSNLKRNLPLDVSYI